jgi:acyl carrier protein
MITIEIRRIIGVHGRVSVDPEALGPQDDLYAAGLTSHASVSLMLALEDAFDIEFPEQLLKRSTFASIVAIEEAITDLQGRAAPVT